MKLTVDYIRGLYYILLAPYFVIVILIHKGFHIEIPFWWVHVLEIILLLLHFYRSHLLECFCTQFWTMQSSCVPLIGKIVRLSHTSFVTVFLDVRIVYR